MRFLGSLFLVVVLAFVASPGYSLSISQAEYDGLTFTDHHDDLLTDHSGGSGFSIYGISCTMENGYLYVAVHTNFPKAGLSGSDSYGQGILFNPGDLYINVGGSFQSGTGSAYGVATTTHTNNVTQAYGSWGAGVTEGGLYAPDGSGNPFFADGTWEVYQAHFSGVVDPASDGDGSMFINSYPTMIRYGSAVGGDVSGVAYLANVGDPWAYDIVYKVDLSAIGYSGTQDLQLFWAMECGNDGVEITKDGEIPEPTTVALLAAGISAMAVRRKSGR